MDAKEEVRSRLNIEDVIGEYVQLKRAGRSFKGLSPFSSEKTPSFFVSPDKNIWHDFSSNKGGDVFAFVMEVEGMDFRAALEHLARKAGVDLSLYEDKNARDMSRKKKRLLEANHLASRYYQQTMVRNQTALEYVFKTRGLDKQVVQDFMIGYAPDSGDALVNMLTKKGFTKRELADAGLTNRFGSDMFRGRMMIPLMDPSGQVVGFTGRIVGDVPNAPKYLNTSQTLLYDKGRHIFGLSQAKEAIRANDYAVVVEGNLDVVSSHQAGVKQVVATAGTAMTEHHLKALKRLTGDVRLAFDGDKAGIAATERAIALASPLGIELTIVSLPDTAKDPDELIQDDPRKWVAAIEARKPAVEWVLEQYSRRVDISTGTGKKQFTSAALRVIGAIADAVEREHYENIVAKMTKTTLGAVREKLDTEKPDAVALKSVQVEKVDPVHDDTYRNLDDALAIACVDVPSQELFAHFDTEQVADEARREMIRYIATHRGAAIVATPQELQQHDNYVTMLLIRADKRLADRKDCDIYTAAALIRKVQHEQTKQTKLDLAKAFDDALERGDTDEVKRINEEIKRLNKEKLGGK